MVQSKFDFRTIGNHFPICDKRLFFGEERLRDKLEFQFRSWKWEELVGGEV